MDNIFTTEEIYKKVACLYRVSTKKQVDKEDIPMQKKACREFIKQHKNWVLYKEYFEKGVSGYKKYAAQRDVLQEVRQATLDHKFDILLVFMFDRLGRKEDETPFVVEWFTQQGIEVWSAKEGQQKFEHHVDKLMNYIRFWQASGESEKTSIRVDTKLKQMAHDGMFHGGTPPYGYHLVPSGKYNKKKKELLKIEIDTEQANVIRQIFNYATQYGFGKVRIAQALNQKGIKSLSNGMWNSATIGFILKNPVYKGYPAYGKRSNKSGTNLNQPKENWILSDKKVEELAIISEKQWKETQDVIQRNKNTKLSNVQNKVTKSPCLFVGKIFCGYCGNPLTTTYNYKWNTDHTKQYKYTKYRCSGKASKCIECQGQTIYSAPIIEKTVLNQIYQHWFKLYSIELNDRNFKTNNIQHSKQKLNIIERKISQEKKEKNVLLQEISKSLMGESVFDSKTLSSLINDKEEKIKSLIQQKEELKKQFNNVQNIEHYKRTIKDVIKNWDSFLKQLDFNKKKMLLRLIINKIIVYKDRIDITFNEDISSFIDLYCNETKKVVDY